MLVACNPGDKAAAPVASGAPAPLASAPIPAKQARVFDVVRGDDATFEETTLGKVRFEKDPPFRAQLIDGTAELPKLVAEMNALDHVMSAGGMGKPGRRIERNEQQFFRIMRRGWLEKTHHVRLRMPANGGAPPVRWEMMALDSGKNVHLGTVTVGWSPVTMSPATTPRSSGRSAGFSSTRRLVAMTRY
jgi:hypothetical protein